MTLTYTNTQADNGMAAAG